MSAKKKPMDRSDRVFYAVIHVVMVFLLIILLYPLIYILSSSFSSPFAVSTGKVFLWPVDISLRGYTEVLKYQPVWLGYRNTIFYAIANTIVSGSTTLCVAFALSKKTLPGRKFFTILYVIPMLFAAGMIPTYLNYRALGMVNTVWMMFLPAATGAGNMIVTRTFISNLPQELSEASQIDGCSDARYFVTMLIPLSKAIIAVNALYTIVGTWNSYFTAMIYLTNRQLYPLQLFLREILILNDIDSEMILDPELAQAQEGMANLLKYSLIVVSTAPVLCVYPFVQKYFAQGVMVGSLKG